MSDSSYANTNPVYGARGVPSLSNQPGTKMGTAQWKDKDGNFWVFGGLDNNNKTSGDIWRYKPDYNCINANCGLLLFREL